MDEFQFLTPKDDKKKTNRCYGRSKLNKLSLKFKPHLKTPNGSKVPLSFVNSLVMGRNYGVKEKYFREKESITNSFDLSPDFAGELFPKPISFDQYELKRNECVQKMFRNKVLEKTSEMLNDDSVIPSPDLGYESYLQIEKTRMLETDSLLSNFQTPPSISKNLDSFMHTDTPPSHFKWNRPEYRTNRDDSIMFPIDNDNQEIDDEYLPNDSWDFNSRSICSSGPVSDLGHMDLVASSVNMSHNPDNSITSLLLNSDMMAKLSSDSINDDKKLNQNTRCPYYRSSPQRMFKQKDLSNWDFSPIPKKVVASTRHPDFPECFLSPIRTNSKEKPL